MMLFVTVPDPDFEIRLGGWGGGDHPDPSIRGGRDWSPKKFFSAFRASVWSKNRGGRGGPAGPLPWIRQFVNLESYLVDVTVTPLD